jgi:hypothetical protein
MWRKYPKNLDLSLANILKIDYYLQNQRKQNLWLLSGVVLLLA